LTPSRFRRSWDRVFVLALVTSALRPARSTSVRSLRTPVLQVFWLALDLFERLWVGVYAPQLWRFLLCRRTLRMAPLLRHYRRTAWHTRWTTAHVLPVATIGSSTFHRRLRTMQFLLQRRRKRRCDL